MTAYDRRRNPGRRSTDRLGVEGSGRTSSRTAGLIAALRAGEGDYDPDEVADHLLRLDVLRLDAVRKIEQQRAEWTALVDDLEARLEASMGRRAVAAAELRRLADVIDGIAPGARLAGDLIADLLRIANDLVGGSTETAESGE